LGIFFCQPTLFQRPRTYALKTIPAVFYPDWWKTMLARYGHSKIEGEDLVLQWFLEGGGSFVGRQETNRKKNPLTYD